MLGRLRLGSLRAADEEVLRSRILPACRGLAIRGRRRAAARGAADQQHGARALDAPQQDTASPGAAELLLMGAARLLATRAAVAAANAQALSAFAGGVGAPIIACPADDTYVGSFLPSPVDNASDKPENTGGLLNHVELCEGARVMLRINIDVADGLANGACGYVVGLVLDDSTMALNAAWARFDRGGRRWCAAHATDTVRIDPVCRSFMGNDGARVQRRQLPLVLAWAKTIHKSQGATEEHGIVATLDSSAQQPGMVYVAVSRCRRLADVHLTAFSPEAVVTPAGVEGALARLLLQQSTAAAGHTEAWQALFCPRASRAELEASVRDAPQAEWQRVAEARRRIREAEEAGAAPEAVCAYCHEAFFGEASLARHDKVCPRKPHHQRQRRGRGRGRQSGR
jgi:hypothetical protein